MSGASYVVSKFNTEECRVENLILGMYVQTDKKSLEDVLIALGMERWCRKTANKAKRRVGGWCHDRWKNFQSLLGWCYDI